MKTTALNCLLFPAALASAVALTACSAFTPPKEKPVIEDQVGDRIGTIATTAERRVVLVDLKNEHFCAEAAPDVAESVNSSIRAAVEYTAKAEGSADKTVGAELARQLTTSLMTLFSRTQGIQLFRDGAYALCQARMNGDIQGADFRAHFSTLLNKAEGLIRDEIPQVAKRMADNAVAASQTAASDSKTAAKRSEAAAASASEAAKSAADSASKVSKESAANTTTDSAGGTKK